MPKAAHSFCVKFTCVGRALSRAGFVTYLSAEGRSTPMHRQFRLSRRECGMPNVKSPLILSACGNGGQHFEFSPCSFEGVVSVNSGSRTLQVSGKAFLLICTSHESSGLGSILMKHNRSGLFGSTLTVMVVCSILPDLSRWAKNSMSLHHFFSELIHNACSF